MSQTLGQTVFQARKQGEKHINDCLTSHGEDGCNKCVKKNLY